MTDAAANSDLQAIAALFADAMKITVTSSEIRFLATPSVFLTVTLRKHEGHVSTFPLEASHLVQEFLASWSRAICCVRTETQKTDHLYDGNLTEVRGGEFVVNGEGVAFHPWDQHETLTAFSRTATGDFLPPEPGVVFCEW